MLAQQQVHVRDQWNRSLPFGDHIVDRWEKARELGFGEGTSIYDSALLLGDVAVGRNTWIGPFTVLDGSGGLVIGDHCSISAGVHIYTHDTVKWAVSGGAHSPEHAPVRIGNRCYIGPNVVISKGVTIGDCCVIGANSFVNSDLPAETKAWGFASKSNKLRKPMARNFSTISNIDPEDGSTWADKLFLTFDIDWAHDDVLLDTAALINESGALATWFVTHATPVLDDIRELTGHEVGIHPNFNHLLDGIADNGRNGKDIIKTLLDIVPEAKSLRSH